MKAHKASLTPNALMRRKNSHIWPNLLRSCRRADLVDVSIDTLRSGGASRLRIERDTASIGYSWYIRSNRTGNLRGTHVSTLHRWWCPSIVRSRCNKRGREPRKAENISGGAPIH